METLKYFKLKGTYIGANMWEIWNDDETNVYHYAESTRPNGKARYMINGTVVTEAKIREELKIED